MNSIDLDYQNILSWVPEEELFARQGDVDRHHQALATGKGAGADYRGWMDLPSQMADSLLSRVEAEAARIREEAEAFVCIGIGGSYLGARAAITFCGHAFANALTPERRGGPEIYFAGQNISSDYLSDLLDVLGERKFCINVISKSGTTTEPAIAFRLLKNRLEHRFGRTGAQARIVVTTDQAKGALKQLADSEGYPSFVIPGNVGGRYSVLTPVGLLPIAVAGIPIRELLEGAGRLEEQMRTNSRLEENSAYLYAVIRNALYAKGKTMELMAGFHPALESILEWWKQLAGESEGKDQKGLFPASVQYTTDLHSLGQWVQEGNRILFETFLVMKNSNRQIDVPAASEDLDGLNYLAGKPLDFVNEQAFKGTAQAHREGEVPNLTLTLSDRSPSTLGELFYFFERAIALSGYLLGVNPFDQPGVEFYKRNMFRLLNKPGF